MRYDMLHSPDAVVADVPATARQMVDRLGLLPPKPSWFQSSSCHGYEAVFARVHPSRVVAPSRIEIIAPAPQTGTRPEDIPAYIAEAAAYQGDRPLKTHATVLTSPSFDDLVDELASKGVRHRVDPPSADLGHERLWIGFTAGGGSKYLPDDDAGLLFEVISTQCLQLPDDVAAGVTPDISAVPDGGMVRVAARSHLTADLDESLATLESRLGWPAERLEGVAGSRRAVMAANFPRSARFELLEAGVDSDTEEHFARWGPGTFATRITVRGLAAKAADLSDRNTGFRWLSPSSSPDLLRVDVDVVPGFLIDFVDDADELAVSR
jgi:hypothetical protein